MAYQPRCPGCQRLIVKGTEAKHRGSCDLCSRADHPTCVHVIGFVCPEDGCVKVIRPGADGPVPLAAVNSHRKSHGLPSLDAQGRSGHPVQGGSSGDGPGGWLGDLLEGIGDAIGSILD